MIAPPLHSALGVLDAGRSRVYAALQPFSRSILAHRERRIGTFGSGLLVVALLLAITAPLLLLALGPIVWGVPHLVADVRYLVVQPRLQRAPALYAAGAALVATSMLGFGVQAGLFATMVAAAVSAGSAWRRLGVIAVAALLLALAHRDAATADVLFLHAHNLIAFGYLFALGRSARRGASVGGRLAVGVVFCIGSALIAFAELPSAIIATSASWSGLSLDLFASFLSPSSDPSLRLRWVMFFAFAQAAHYVVWLHLLPQHMAPRGEPRTFNQSYRALVAEVGAPILWVALVAAVLVMAVAIFSLAGSRQLYLGIAFFHAHLELVAAGLLFCRAGGVEPRR